MQIEELNLDELKAIYVRSLSRTKEKALLADVRINKLLTPSQAACTLQLAPATMANWRVRRTGPPFIKCGGSVRYSEPALALWIRTNTMEPQSHDKVPAKLALPVRSPRKDVLRQHRTGRHITQRERSAQEERRASD